MNASFALQGVLIVAGALLVRPLFPRGRLARAGLALAGASGLGVFTVGLAPEDFAPGPHYFGAVENFLFSNGAMVLVGVALLASPARRIAGFASLAAGALGLAGLALLGARIYPGLGVGIIERVTAYPFVFWLAGMGFWLWANSRPDRVAGSGGE